MATRSYVIPDLDDDNDNESLHLFSKRAKTDNSTVTSEITSTSSITNEVTSTSTTINQIISTISIPSSIINEREIASNSYLEIFS
jgi:carbohydrate-binding DOMON domain-containing protein